MAERSTHVTFINKTHDDLRLLHANLSHGIWSQDSLDSPFTPPEIIGFRSEGNWQSESQGFATGTEGMAEYEMNIDGDDDNRLFIILHWDNPFIGSNSYSSRLSDSKRFKITRTGGSGDNATVTFELSRL